MGPDVASQVAELLARHPWQPPAPLTRTGDADVDAAIDKLEASHPNVYALANAEAALSRLAASTHPDVGGALLDVMEKEAAAFAPPDWSTVLRENPPTFVMGQAFLAYQQALEPWTRRRHLVVLLVLGLEARMDDALRDRIVAVVERGCPASMADVLLRSLLGWRLEPPMLWNPFFDARSIAPRRHLEAIARHLVPGDPLLAYAAEAALAIDSAEARARVAALIATASPAERADVFAKLSERLTPRIDFDAEVGWVDVLAPMMAAPPLVTLSLGSWIREAKTSAPMIAALAHAPDDDAIRTDLLGRLRQLDDPAAAEPLTKAGKALSDPRVRAKVLRLAKRLARDRTEEAAAAFVETAKVGTDGGPIVLVDATAAEAWAGAPQSYGTADCPPDNDYDRACAASPGGAAAFVAVGGTRALVLPEQTCGFGALDGGGALLVVMGSAIEIGQALGSSFRRLAKTFEVGDRGAVLLDASFTLAAAPEGASASVPLVRGTYRVEERSADGVHVVRLLPIEPKEPAKKPGASRPKRLARAD